MKSLKTKVIMSAIVLVFALIATIGSTYAWFTVSNVVTVNTLSITVESSESLLIRPWNSPEAESEGALYGTYNYGAGATAWTLDDFSSIATITDSPYYANYADWRLLPATALQGETASNTAYSSIDITALRYLTSPTAADRPLLSAGSNSASGYYLEFKFWLLRPAGINTDVVFDYTASGTYADALHVGVVGDDVSESEVQTLFGNDLDYGFAWTSSNDGFNGDATDSVVNWLAAPLTASDVAFTATDTITSTLLDLSVFEAGDKITITGSASNNGTFTVVTASANTLTVSEAIATESAGASVTINGAINSALAAIEGTEGTTVVNYLESPNVPELVSVIVYVEGWDSDTTIAIMGASFSLDMTFTLQ